MATVIGLTCYPIKGCRGTSSPDADMTQAGLAHDRAFMVIDEGGVFRSQRRDPRLALVRPEIEAAGEWLTLRADGMDTVRVEVDLTSTRRDVELFGVRYTGVDQGDAAAEWLSEMLGRPSRLVRVPPEHDRVTDGLTPGTCGYADSGAVLVATVSSLAALNTRIEARGAEPVPMSRFRPNIVVDGWDEAHTEDRMRRFEAGDAELAYAKLAIRCAVTLVDQESGGRAGPEPLRTLADYRRASSGVAFGAKFSVLRPGKLSVGDEVTVTAWGDSAL
ncbi:MOSC domain-containing protein [Planotetraspora mira]|uniref:Molybdenum cofactor sulfurase n=1 Tax=Planotetraspora mira TaxID=58121 RepID=A0A8J3X8H6_9ACTN|nr:MOSC N-terminal beta barrel domain-containing protein [Planotetraspora mira]GII31296.1 molybdenum cofactor sulfurase [Planotetraspora mira]